MPCVRVSLCARSWSASVCYLLFGALGPFYKVACCLARLYHRLENFLRVFARVRKNLYPNARWVFCTMIQTRAVSKGEGEVAWDGLEGYLFGNTSLNGKEGAALGRIISLLLSLHPLPE